ncbi:hypothetical protein BDV96DRAFT_601313 [Lophiotrema nucula]|uniref:Uncharacterized protein n=1 Tax=Lophiotrema nucula TaxID=690887 RepID=A0A6A5Z600_9PLEO|nr:hypothetical protein BDV96DRAFT_601313 [Lophiotrema nucula]
MLFTFGWTVTGLAVLLWRIATGFDVRWDPSLYHRNKLTIGRLFQACYPLFLNTVFVFQIWFWTAKVGATYRTDCPRNGFLFMKIALNNRWFRTLNASIYVLLLVLTTLFLLANFKPIAAVGGSGIYSRLTQTRSVSASLAMLYYILNSLADLFVATTVLVATELSIRCNNITGASSIRSPGQIIPLLIGIACALRVLYSGRKRLFDKTQLTVSGFLGPSTDLDENMQDETNDPPGSNNDESAPLELIAASTSLQDTDMALQQSDPGQLQLNCSSPHAQVLEPILTTPSPDLANNSETTSSFGPEFSQDEEMQPVSMTVLDATSTSTSIPTTLQESNLTTRTPKKVTVTGIYGGGTRVYYGGSGALRDGG